MNEQRNPNAGPVTAPRREPVDPTYTPAAMRARNEAPDPSRPTGPRPPLVVREEGGVDGEKRSSGIRDVVGGCVLIGIGFLWGSSVFLGNPTALDWVFDGLGTFWLCKGLFNIFTA